MTFSLQPFVSGIYLLTYIIIWHVYPLLKTFLPVRKLVLIGITCKLFKLFQILGRKLNNWPIDSVCEGDQYLTDKIHKSSLSVFSFVALFRVDSIIMQTNMIDLEMLINIYFPVLGLSMWSSFKFVEEIFVLQFLKMSFKRAGLRLSAKFKRNSDKENSKYSVGNYRNIFFGLKCDCCYGYWINCVLEKQKNESFHWKIYLKTNETVWLKSIMKNLKRSLDMGKIMDG